MRYSISILVFKIVKKLIRLFSWNKILIYSPRCTYLRLVSKCISWSPCDFVYEVFTLLPVHVLEAGRSRRRKRDFFGTIRRRLNRSRGRAKSIDRNALSNGEASKDETTTSPAGCNSPSTRSISADRARDHSAHSVHSTGNVLWSNFSLVHVCENLYISKYDQKGYLYDVIMLLL